MSLTIKYLDIAREESDVDVMSCSSDKDYLYIEFAKIISKNAESGDIEEIEVRSNLKLPIKNALLIFDNFIRTLIKHEDEFKDGHGLKLPETSEIE